MPVDLSCTDSVADVMDVPPVELEFGAPGAAPIEQPEAAPTSPQAPETDEDRRRIETLLAMLPESLRKEPAVMEMVSKLPLDRRERVRALRGSLADLKLGVDDFLAFKYAELIDD